MQLMSSHGNYAPARRTEIELVLVSYCYWLSDFVQDNDVVLGRALWAEFSVVVRLLYRLNSK